MEGELEKLEAELEARRGQVDKALSIFSRAKVALVELSEQQKKLESLRERVARVITTVLTR